MAYGRYRKRTGTRRSPYTRRKHSAYRKKKFVRAVKSIAYKTQETKQAYYAYSSVGSGGVSFNSVGFGSSSIIATLLGGISQGTTGATRIGRKIYVVGVKLYLPSQPGDDNNYLRYVLFTNKRGGQDSAWTAGTWAQALMSNHASSATQWAEDVDRLRYRVLYDKTKYLRYVPTGDTGAANHPTLVPQTGFFRAWVPVKKVFTWDEQNSLTDELYLFAISDSAAIANPGAIAGYVQVYYKDA